MNDISEEIDYKDLVNNLIDVIIILDSNGRFLWVSPQVQDVLGYDSEEIIGREGFNYIHKDDIEDALK